MSQLDAKKRAKLPNSAFAYVDSQGRKRLPINDESHVRNALARFNQVVFEDEAARERARKRLLGAAKKYGIVPIGFMTGQLQSRTSEATAGRLVIELGRSARRASSSSACASRCATPRSRSCTGRTRPAAISMAPGNSRRCRTRQCRREATRNGARGDAARAPGPADDRVDPRPCRAEESGPGEDGTAALRLAVENDRLRGEVEAQASEVRTLPGGSITFLLTDIEGSTGLLQRLGDRYAALLADVRAVIRSCMHRAGGREVDARADEFFAVFVRASAALEAAVAIERGLRSRAWPDGVGVRVRVGIHSGRPTLTDSGYVGLAVHTVARICSAAHGGQILLSGAARDAVGRARPAGLRLRSLGSHRLRGLRETQVIFQLEGPDLLGRFPPLRTLTASDAESA